MTGTVIRLGSRSQGAELRACAEGAAAYLQARLPFVSRVEVEVRDDLGSWAESLREEDVFRVVLDDDVPPGDFVWEIVAHEWAHGLVWYDQAPGESDHHDRWGVAYAECYRTVFE